MITTKRVYENPDDEDGFRVLIDRLWPRGLSKEKAKLDLWMKDIAPSNNLRKWFGHDPTRWKDFKTNYLEELDNNNELVKQLKLLEKYHNKLTLLYSAKDTKHNNAIVLRDC